MKKQILVIGLGQFGMSLARAVTDRGAEVFAVDSKMERIRVAANFAAEAVCFDATDTEALKRASPADRDACVCAIGDESRESAIICTALLRQMGAPRVIARANDELQSRILHLVGAHEVVNPEREFGERFANRLVYEYVMGELPLGADLVITELKPPAGLVGRSLSELKLPRNFGINVVALRRGGLGAVVVPDPEEPLKDSDILVVVSREGAVRKLMERM